MDLTEIYTHFGDLFAQRARHGSLALPNIVGVGAPRAGTSWLFKAFEGHPKAWVPPGKMHKEMNYFGIQGYTGRPGRISLSEYAIFFEQGRELPVRAEFTPVYLGHDPSLEHLVETLPDVKVIVQIRDRRERLWSQFKYHRDQHGYDDFEQFVVDGLDAYDTTVRRDTRWFSPAKILSHSLYAPGVDHLLTGLGRDRVLVLDYRQLAGAPDSYARAAFEFAGIDADHGGPATPVNTSREAGAPNLPIETERQLASLFDADRHRMRDLGFEQERSTVR
jgi:hypothetical protein